MLERAMDGQEEEEEGWWVGVATELVRLEGCLLTLLLELRLRDGQLAEAHAQLGEATSALQLKVGPLRQALLECCFWASRECGGRMVSHCAAAGTACSVD